ncbi:MAG: YecA family protein [Candidatus Methylacidiphilales bacterium]
MSKIGRNSLCPSGKQIKFKKCLQTHALLREGSSAASVWWVCDAWQPEDPSALEMYMGWPAAGSVPFRPPQEKLDLYFDSMASAKPEGVWWGKVLLHLTTAQDTKLDEHLQTLLGCLPAGVKVTTAEFYINAARVLAITRPDLLPVVAKAMESVPAEILEQESLRQMTLALLACNLDDAVLSLLAATMPKLAQMHGSQWGRTVAPTINLCVTMRLAQLAKNPPPANAPINDAVRNLLGDIGIKLEFGHANLVASYLTGRKGWPEWSKQAFELTLPEGIDMAMAPLESKYLASNMMLRVAVDEHQTEGLHLGPAMCAAEDFLNVCLRWNDKETAGNIATALTHPELDEAITRCSMGPDGVDHNMTILILHGMRMTARALGRHGIITEAESAQALSEADRMLGLVRRKM